ncbi:high mobility group protein B3-like [Cebus imitator]|uniref:high mobility group protein B3-like n=1 Tax=Cebus imitator TaxID=2715852 RepID=UPI00189A215F|nr:high mobility group protein B3-like [Cebus imitator]
MAKGDPKKPKGKMSAYAFFVQTCRKEHKKKSPEVPVNFAEFSKKCSERWKTMSGKEKSKFDEMAKVDKVRYDREMKDYGPAKGGKKKKDPNAPKREFGKTQENKTSEQGPRATGEPVSPHREAYKLRNLAF